MQDRVRQPIAPPATLEHAGSAAPGSAGRAPSAPLENRGQGIDREARRALRAQRIASAAGAGAGAGAGNEFMRPPSAEHSAPTAPAVPRPPTAPGRGTGSDRAARREEKKQRQKLTRAAKKGGGRRGGVGEERGGNRAFLVVSAIIMIALPTLFTAVYLWLFAAQQFAVEVRFAIRSPSSATSAGDVMGAMTGIPAATSSISDSYIVMDYVQSREVIDEMEKQIGFRAIYSRDQADFWARLDPTQSVENVVRYWRSMIRVNFDTISQIISFEIRAFSAADAKNVAETLLKLAEQQVNDLSARSRADAVRSSQVEVERMEERVRNVRLAMREFREKYGDFDPLKTAEAQIGIQSTLEQELSKSRAELRTLSQYMAADAPSVDVVRNKIKALERQIAEERNKLGRSGAMQGTSVTQDSLTRIVSRYEGLLVEREFADKALVSALGSLERARSDADRQQRYMAAFVRPQLPQMALYPQRLMNTIIMLGMASLIWALTVLLVYAIRDHAT